MLGMTLATFTFLHVLISLIGLLRGYRMGSLTAVFLATTALTSITGFAFPFTQLLPSHKVGIISLVLLAFAIPARYVFHLAGPWRLTYVVTAAMALYLNCFVLVVQLFMKVPALRALAPTQKEPPFLVAQLMVLALFIGLTILAARRFRVGSVQTA
jgi:hypothetical protein